MFKNLFANLQKVGKALMLPVSVLPVAGILLGVGAAHLSFIPEIVSNLMEQAGGSVFGQMALLFAVGVALGFTNNDGVAGLAAIVGYGIMTATLGVMAGVMGVEKSIQVYSVVSLSVVLLLGHSTVSSKFNFQNTLASLLVSVQCQSSLVLQRSSLV